MTSRRKAELQRKLSLKVVPRPPADLGERIKRDLPHYLHPHQAPGNRFPSITLRVAASVMVVLSSLLAALYLAEPDSETKMASAPSLPRPVPTLTLATGENATAAESAARVRLQEQRPELDEAPELAGGIAAASPPPALTEASAQAGSAGHSPPPALADLRQSREEYAPEPQPPGSAVADEVHNGERRDVESNATSMAETMPAPAERNRGEAAAAPSISAPVAQAASGRAAKAMDSAAPAMAPALPGNAGERRFNASPRLFGVSLDRQVFDRIRTAIENGSRPDPQTVDVEAIINYFAGAADRPPGQGLRLEVEASPAPVASDGDHAVLRVTIDASRMHEHGSLAVAKDAALDVRIDLRSVIRFRRLGDGTPLRTEAVMPPDASVTMLYELELAPRLNAKQHVATVRLTWTSPASGKKHAIERTVTARELAGDWKTASRRHRLASLGALWSQTLKGTGSATAVARRAAELAAQDPGNVRARELATLSSASSP